MDRTEQRIARLERLVSDLDSRLVGIEEASGQMPAAPAPPRPAAPAPPRPAAASPRPAPSAYARPAWSELGRDDLEDLVGGRVLAWVGGLAVLLGIVFLFAMAISNGWIGETARVVLAASGSAALLVLGVWLHERKARTDAALAAVATGIGGLFVSVTVAAQVYELLPQGPAVVLAMAVGAIATALAVRWESRGIASLGILGGIAAPILAGATGDGGAMVLLFIALTSAAGVLLWLRWDWLAMTAFLLATPQWIGYLVEGEPSLSAQLATLVGFGALGVAVAVGHDIRVRAERLRSSSCYLMVLNAIVVAGAGWVTLWDSTGTDAANTWLVGVAVVHAAVGLGGRFLRLSNDIRLLALAIGAVVADVSFGLIAHGPALAIGWTVTGVAFAALLRRMPRRAGRDAAVLTEAGLGGHLALAMLSAIAVSDPVPVLQGTQPLSTAGAASVLALAAGCLVSARIAGERHESWRIALDSMGLIAIAVLTAMTLDGVDLVIAWSLEVAALAGIAHRTGDQVAAVGALGFVALAGAHAVLIEVPPGSLVTGLAEPTAGIAALAAVAACLVLLGALADPEQARARTVLRGVAALTVLYLASTVVVTPFESDAAVDSALLSAHQQGQMVLSVFWGLVGVGTIVVGLRSDLGIVRLAGLALLGVTVGKVFLFDLATLTSMYRVVSFVGLGLLLLGGALVWQRLRPQELADLRQTPAGIR